MRQSLLRAMCMPSCGDGATSLANLFLRIAFGLLVFIVHGLQEALDAIHYMVHRAEWMLVSEIREMGLPAPVFQAGFATFIQLIAPLCIILGLCTRPASVLLAAVLMGAVAQNVHAGRDPQLALLYLLIAVTLACWGGGQYSLDAARQRSRMP